MASKHCSWFLTAYDTLLLLLRALSNRYAELEVMLSEAGRARALYELAISQPVLDMPEALWKAYIDFEIAQVSTRAGLDARREWGTLMMT
jgi:hypothetical protein